MNTISRVLFVLGCRQRLLFVRWNLFFSARRLSKKAKCVTDYSQRPFDKGWGLLATLLGPSEKAFGVQVYCLEPSMSDKLQNEGEKSVFSWPESVEWW